MYILQVVPLIKLPNTFYQILTYFNNTPIPIGALVQVEVKNKHIMSVVIQCESIKEAKLSLKKENIFALKKVTQSLSDTPILTPTQIELALWMSEYYAYSLGIIFKMFLPKLSPTLKKIPKILSLKSISGPTDKIDLTNLSSSITIMSQYGSLYAPFHERLNVYKSIINNLSSDHTAQVLFLVPDLFTQSELINHLADSLEHHSYCVINSEVGTKDYRIHWTHIKQGLCQIIIGTRRALFMPFVNLKRIIIEQESSFFYYSPDLNPKYHTVQIATKLASVHTAQLLFAGETFSINTAALLHQRHISFIPETNTVPNFSLTSVNMLNEIRTGNKTLLSQKLQTEISKALVIQRPIMLFINRRGESTYICCNDCGLVITCAYCDSTLVEHRNDIAPASERNIILLCHKCQRAYKSLQKCPRCESYNIKFSGTGIEKIASVVQTMYPEAQIDIIDRDYTPLYPAQINVFNQFRDKKIQILLCTQMIEKFLYYEFDQKPLIAVFSLDSMIHFPDYSTGERTYGLLTRMLNTGYKTIVQRYKQNDIQEEHEQDFIDLILKNDFEAFYQHEIDQRKKFQHPPFSQILKITTAHGNSAKALSITLNTKKVLEGLNLKPFGPVQEENFRRRKQTIYSLILKVHPLKSIAVKKRLMGILVPGQNIEVNPIPVIR